MVAAMYLRKSRAEENESVEVTLARHRETLMDFAKANGITVGAAYEEVVSGETLIARPKMLLLLSELEKFDAVLCMDIDRLGRGAMGDQGIIFDAIKNANALIVTPAQTYDLRNDQDDTMIAVKALVAREEYKIIRARLRRGVLRSVDEGCYVSNAPYGYRQVRVNKKPTLEIFEEEAACVRLIFRLYTEGKGCQVIADTVHDLGYRPRRGAKFNRTSIAKILRNPTYIGKVVWNQHEHVRPRTPGDKHKKRVKPPSEWHVTQGLHPAIVSEELFKRANQRLKEKYHPPYRHGDQIENPFAGVMKCAVCGKTMVRQPLSSHKISEPILMCPTKGCCMSTKLRLVEDFFAELLEEVLQGLQLNLPADPPKPPEDFSEKILAEQRKTESQLLKLHELLEQGVYDIDTFVTRREALQKRMESLQARLKEKKPAPSAADISRQLETALAGWDQATPAERNQLIKAVIAEIRYTKPKGSGQNTLPRLEITKWRT